MDDNKYGVRHKNTEQCDDAFECDRCSGVIIEHIKQIFGRKKTMDDNKYGVRHKNTEQCDDAFECDRCRGVIIEHNILGRKKQNG